jgi:hypothetical protein
MKKLIKMLNSIYKSIKLRYHFKLKQKLNRNLRKSKSSDLQRWNDDSSLFQDWNERTAIMASFVISNKNIIEFGAGNMYLKEYLNGYKSYTPSDIVKRFDETLICDLNKKIKIDLTKYEVAIFSGVLEYVFDIDSLFKQLSNKIPQVILSYACSDVVKMSREQNGWLSDYNKQELEAIFKKYNYEVINYVEWRNQSIFNLMKF